MAEVPNSGGGSEGPGDSGGSDLYGRRTLRSPGETLEPGAVPPPPGARKKRPFVATLSSVLSFVGIAAVALVILVSLGIQRVGAPGPLPADKVVVIAPGTDVSDIIDQLQSAGVIDSSALMSATLIAEGDRNRIKAGEYLFKQSASLREVIDTLVSGKQILHAITIPEGLTSEQAVDRLNGDDILTGDVKTVPKEGTLMPDTYKFARGTTRDQLLHTMQQEQKRIVAEVWSHRAADLPIRSPFEMLTLASIVEKETGKADERPRVAGVFVNRLTRGIPLQSDPTVVYGLVGGKGTLGRGILKSELEQKTPYNTYAVSGLPPGPICNPGRAAMEAVANPSRTKDIYFVADGTGGHAFAETLDQHRQNVARWRQIEKDAKDKAAPDAADKTLPTTPSPLPKNQRGDLEGEVPIYGVLTERFGTGPATPAATLLGMMQPPVVFDRDSAVADKFAPLASDPTEALDPDRVPDDATLAASAAGPAAGSAEERALATATGPMMTFPVSAAQRADERARAAHYGVPPGSDSLPLASATGAEVASTDQGAPRAVPGKGRITDASEGTRLDPLLDKSYDLNSAKTVPGFKMTELPAPTPPVKSARIKPSTAKPPRGAPTSSAADAPAQ